MSGPNHRFCLVWTIRHSFPVRQIRSRVVIFSELSIGIVIIFLLSRSKDDYRVIRGLFHICNIAACSFLYRVFCLGSFTRSLRRLSN